VREFTRHKKKVTRIRFSFKKEQVAAVFKNKQSKREKSGSGLHFLYLFFLFKVCSSIQRHVYLTIQVLKMKRKGTVYCTHSGWIWLEGGRDLKRFWLDEPNS